MFGWANLIKRNKICVVKPYYFISIRDFHSFVCMKVQDDKDYIYKLIAQGEHLTQDFKYEISDISKIARTLSAFANTEGGRLLIGVKDNGKVTGVRSEEEVYMIEAAAQLYCVPLVALRIQNFIVEGKTVLMVEVEPNKDQKPVYAKDHAGKLWAYIRIHDENILATPIHLKVWKQKDSPAGTLLKYTEREKFLLNLLGEEEFFSLNKYCRKAKISRRAAENLLAQFIRFNIVEFVFLNHKFHYRLKKEITQSEHILQ